jgi:hypothetical protein
MNRRWLVLIASVAIAMVVGFRRIEPLNELRRYGSVSPFGVWVDGKLHGLRFVSACESLEQFREAMKVLRRCPSVNRIYVQRIKDLRHALFEVAATDHIAAIELRRTDVNEDDLAVLSGMKNLQFLDLSRNPSVTDAGVAALSGLENLRYLDLERTNVTGTGLKDRSDMVSLYQLTLNDCPVTDESLATIPRFPKLEELLLGRTKVTDKGLMSLVGWHSLRRVTRTALTTKAGSKAFNEAFLADRRKAREAGVQMDSRDIPPVLIDETFWRK